ncbi:dimethylsulfonioproprionate lyase DddP [Nisaea sp.]|uniref:dimethylsulfonioproprionate lyase DddP n=1 Tax=Nisaea sp. TaxID=2024842 RepID=UPI0032968F0B
MAIQFSVSVPKINPARRPGNRHALRPDNTPDDNDRTEIGPTALAYSEWQAAGLDCPDLQAMRLQRWQRLTDAVVARDYAGLLMYDPLSIRYATDTTNMQLWASHNPFRACLLLADGHMVLWEYGGLAHLSAFNPLVREVRKGASFFYFSTGDRTEEKAGLFADQIDNLLREHTPGNRRLAVDKIQIAGLRALDLLGIEVMDGEEVTERTRAVKGAEEIKAMRCAMHACEQSIAGMRAAARPGMTENDLWAELHKENIRRGGEWIETRILSSGPRTNPWFRECGPRVIGNNELVSWDSDLIGCYGMCADISRSWFIGDGQPTEEQKRLHAIAVEHIMTNRELLKPGVSFRELSLGGHLLPEEFITQRYGSKFHGVGLCDEWPAIPYPEDLEAKGYDGVLESGMMLCVEVYLGAVGAPDGIKLENQVLITENGYEDLTNCPFDEKLMG